MHACPGTQGNPPAVLLGLCPWVVYLLSIFRHEEDNTPCLSKTIGEFKQMKLLGFHPGQRLVSGRKLAILEMAIMSMPRLNPRSIQVSFRRQGGNEPSAPT
jgi:hypothetical protein